MSCKLWPHPQHPLAGHCFIDQSTKLSYEQPLKFNLPADLSRSNQSNDSLYRLSFNLFIVFFMYILFKYLYSQDFTPQNSLKSDFFKTKLILKKALLQLLSRNKQKKPPMSREDSYICICVMYKILFAVLWENSLWRVTNFLSYRTQRCSDGKPQASKGMSLVGSKWWQLPAAVHPPQFHRHFLQGHLSQGLQVGGKGTRRSLSEQSLEPCPGGKHSRAGCSPLLSSPALLLPPCPAFEPSETAAFVFL